MKNRIFSTVTRIIPLSWMYHSC